MGGRKMAKRETVITMQIRMPVPTGSNAAEVMSECRDAIKDSLMKKGTKWTVSIESMTLKMIKKEVSYI
jgi:hypothetical protein